MKYRNKAFTLIELLVVITIIALLVSILMPSLNKAKQQATATVCLGNQKALITAWLMYAGDNGDRIVGGMRSTYLNTGGDVSYRNNEWEPAGKYAWACAPAVQQMNDKNASVADLGTELSLTYRKRGVELGKMWKYVKTHEVYHCPGDKSEKLAKPLDSFVTYAISSSMNGEDAIPTAVVPAYKSTGQIKNSVERMVFLEENKHEQPYLRGSFALDIRGPKANILTNSTWKDYPANWHNKKGTLAFADGHAEITPWESPMTLQLAMDTKRNFNFSANDKYSLNNPDLQKFIRWYGAIR